MKKNNHASFRDPAGFVFHDEAGTVHRQINQAGAGDYQKLMSSGLYDELVKAGQLIAHEEKPRKKSDSWHAIIKPAHVPFITYPFEWSFSQLKDAALLTLTIQQKALAKGMSLKDASAYNMQFLDGKPVLIDTLSFEVYHEGSPWKAYRQFCEHFLAPLALMAYSDLSLSQLLRIHLDGIPLGLAVKLLPRRARLRPGLLMHLFLHARAQSAKAGDHKTQQAVLRQAQLEAVLANLKNTVAHLRPLHATTEWGDYYRNTNYTATAADNKAKLIRTFVKPLKFKTALDLGGNNGHYARVLNEFGVSAICSDIDPNAVEANYQIAKKNGSKNMLPLVIDLKNPGGAIGWANRERAPIHERLQVDLVMALALVHHLAISNNVPFEKLAEYFSSFGPYLIIEFIPKADSQVKKLLSTREDVFAEYDQEHFVAAFLEHYTLEQEAPIDGTLRTLYLFKRK